MKYRKRHVTISINSIFLLLLCLYTSAVIILASIACYYSYQERKNGIIAELDKVLNQLKQEYSHKTSDFWKIYMPVFSSENASYDSLIQYFSGDIERQLHPITQRDLIILLREMMLQNDAINWIALVSDETERVNILHKSDTSFRTIEHNFPYTEMIHKKESRMVVLPAKDVSGRLNSDPQYDSSYAICGGIPGSSVNGSIVVGFRVLPLDQICDAVPASIKTANFFIRTDQYLIYDSKRIYPQVDLTGYETNDSEIYYTVSRWEIVTYAHQNTPAIVLVVLLFLAIPTCIYIVATKTISKKVSCIQDGLTIIGSNDLAYRLNVNSGMRELNAIADSINHMTDRLRDNINTTYYYKLKHKEAELAELQSKFNPHFLYNTLEMLRSRIYKNGDIETANLVLQLASIFRSFIGKKTFIPINEELLFCKKYLDLFQYGIIRNILQPIIENYFIHGFDTKKEDNYIAIRGKSLDEKKFMITVEDNGIGAGLGTITELNSRLQESTTLDTQNYGLKNIHQRLQLFYGDDCGLRIRPNADGGLVLELTAGKLTCEEYEGRRGQIL